MCHLVEALHELDEVVVAVEAELLAALARVNVAARGHVLVGLQKRGRVDARRVEVGEEEGRGLERGRPVAGGRWRRVGHFRGGVADFGGGGPGGREAHSG